MTLEPKGAQLAGAPHTPFTQKILQDSVSCLILALSDSGTAGKSGTSLGRHPLIGHTT